MGGAKSAFHRGQTSGWQMTRLLECHRRTAMCDMAPPAGKGEPRRPHVTRSDHLGLVSTPLCCSGTSWLPLPAKEWPKEKREEPPRYKLEERGPRADILDISTPSATLLDVTAFSSASKLNRTRVWMFRFLHNVRSTGKQSGPLTAEEIQGARTYWLKANIGVCRQASTCDQQNRDPIHFSSSRLQ